ncbi:MAG: trehalose-phosphatase [Candidatus Altiarchaeota archaeon]|nr:trehalose-phosphatase [Candidatus Altiarchaeota archaeon]
MKHLLESWDELADVFSREELFLLLDYDGTLTPIVDKPELATLSPEMRKLLVGLGERHTVAIVSGRSLEDVKSLVNVSGIYYAGNHGFEVSGPGVDLNNPELERYHPIIREICSLLEGSLGDIKGVLVENKDLTASLHYRLVSEKDLDRVERLFWSLMEDYIDSGDVRVTSGKMVFEVRPDIEWDKGKAVEWLIKVLEKGNALPVYLGDDRTDEDAFMVLKDKGIGVLVSENKGRDSVAKYFLRDVGEVKYFLSLLAALG